eukprot:1152286-Pelagomonas_calceolata.AAC.5
MDKLDVQRMMDKVDGAMVSMPACAKKGRLLHTSCIMCTQAGETSALYQIPAPTELNILFRCREGCMIAITYV